MDKKDTSNPLGNMKPVENVGEFLKYKNGVFTITAPKYRQEDGVFLNNAQNRLTLEQQKCADRVCAESRRVIDEVTETTKKSQREVDHQLKQRTEEIEFICEELNKQKKRILLEKEALATCGNRIRRTLGFLGEKGYPICQQCLEWREKRIGIDLCEDEVDQELRREMTIMKGCLILLNKILRELGGQVRKLNAASVLLDEDLENKYKALLIDKKNIPLRDTSASFRQGQGQGRDQGQNICLYTLAEWERETYKNLDDSSKEISTGLQMRSYIDTMVHQVTEDLRKQIENTNLAFKRRIAELKQLKHNLEENNKNIYVKIIDVQNVISELEAKTGDKECAILLCQTRLKNRARRSKLELTCDEAHLALNMELKALQATACKLGQKLAESKAMLRYLLHMQIVQAEELNVKTNSIKIDEVECMTLRLGLDLTGF